MQNILTRTFVLRVAILCASLLVAVQAAGQEGTGPPKVHVIPQPRQLLVTRDEFRLNPTASVSLADPHSEDDRFAAQDFIDDLKETASVSLKVGKARKHAIVIGTTDQATVQAALKRAAFVMPDDLDAEGYLLSVTANEVVVAGKTANG